ncbi:MAG: carboxypeptidase regulatory-like domain-containing protein [Chloroflexi bacterium]|nr:carboxypeptidase regulatory-like domain-containing protein [Chloroflexota bacterium]
MKYGYVVAIALALLLFAEADPRASAQSSQLSVNLLTPAENETFYAGPQSLTYSFPVNGWVTTANPEPTLVKVRLEIISGSQVANTLTTRAQDDGSFSFDVTVNPLGPSGDFTPDQKSCSFCHFISDASLPRGQVLLQVTATEPNGNQATAKRNIVVDHSGYATVPVKVVLADKPEQPAPNIPVSGSTRLYLWRTRYQVALTDAQGLAQVRVESLAQAPTHYTFRVEPTVVDGMLYESVAPASATLAPGATTAPAITLRVRGRRGQINGSLNPKGLPDPSGFTVRAIRVPDGMSYSTPLSPDGTFAFNDLPIAEYIVAADAEGYTSLSQRVNLAVTPDAGVSLPVIAIHGHTLRGAVRDVKGNALPFAWIAVEQAGLTHRTMPDSGTFSLSGLDLTSATAVSSAPGYYHQAQAVSFLSASPSLDFALIRRPETRSIACGRGDIIVPPESRASIEKEQIVLDYGWVWSAGECREHRIVVAGTNVTLSNARFAIEYLPDVSTWLYVHSGTASVESSSLANVVTVRGGEMLALANNTRLAPAPYDPAAVTALTRAGPSPILLTWEPTLEARLRDGMAQTGIGLAQATALITYSLIAILFVVAPLVILVWWSRNR